jgi:type II secretion system protein H
MSGARGRAGAGFTLIELVVVTAILAVAATLVAPAVGRGTEALRVRTEAGRVAALLRQARQHAVSQRRTTRVALDPGRNTVTFTAEGVEEPVRELAMPEGIRMSVEAGGETVRFSSRGLTRDTHWMLEGGGGRRLTIRVESLSGRVSVTPEARS